MSSNWWTWIINHLEKHVRTGGRYGREGSERKKEGPRRRASKHAVNLEHSDPFL
jgi:hypothetical protein